MHSDWKHASELVISLSAFQHEMDGIGGVMPY